MESLCALFHCLDAECARACRQGGRIAVLHCSLAGHRGVSGAQQRVVAGLREDGREYDFCAPSGDDVVLVLPGFEPADLPEKRIRMQALVAQIALDLGLPLRLRVGAAFFPADGSDAEDLLAAAHASQV